MHKKGAEKSAPFFICFCCSWQGHAKQQQRQLQDLSVFRLPLRKTVSVIAENLTVNDCYHEYFVLR
jgi:hypothetical protein